MHDAAGHRFLRKIVDQDIRSGDRTFNSILVEQIVDAGGRSELFKLAKVSMLQGWSFGLCNALSHRATGVRSLFFGCWNPPRTPMLESGSEPNSQRFPQNSRRWTPRRKRLWNCRREPSSFSAAWLGRTPVAASSLQQRPRRPSRKQARRKLKLRQWIHLRLHLRVPRRARPSRTLPPQRARARRAN